MKNDYSTHHYTFFSVIFKVTTLYFILWIDHDLCAQSLFWTLGLFPVSHYSKQCHVKFDLPSGFFPQDGSLDMDLLLFGMYG